MFNEQEGGHSSRKRRREPRSRTRNPSSDRTKRRSSSTHCERKRIRTALPRRSSSSGSRSTGSLIERKHFTEGGSSSSSVSSVKRIEDIYRQAELLESGVPSEEYLLERKSGSECIPSTSSTERFRRAGLQSSGAEIDLFGQRGYDSEESQTPQQSESELYLLEPQESDSGLLEIQEGLRLGQEEEESDEDLEIITLKAPTVKSKKSGKRRVESDKLERRKKEWQAKALQIRTKGVQSLARKDDYTPQEPAEFLKKASKADPQASFASTLFTTSAQPSGTHHEIFLGPSTSKFGTSEAETVFGSSSQPPDINLFGEVEFINRPSTSKAGSGSPTQPPDENIFSQFRFSSGDRPFFAPEVFGEPSWAAGPSTQKQQHVRQHESTFTSAKIPASKAKFEGSKESSWTLTPASHKLQDVLRSKSTYIPPAEPETQEMFGAFGEPSGEPTPAAQQLQGVLQSKSTYIPPAVPETQAIFGASRESSWTLTPASQKLQDVLRSKSTYIPPAVSETQAIFGAFGQPSGKPASAAQQQQDVLQRESTYKPPAVPETQVVFGAFGEPSGERTPAAQQQQDVVQHGSTDIPPAEPATQEMFGDTPPDEEQLSPIERFGTPETVRELVRDLDEPMPLLDEQQSIQAASTPTSETMTPTQAGFAEDPDEE